MTLLARLLLPQALSLLAEGYLDEAVAAARRLDDPADVEALHDTRVALRRLHSLLRAYEGTFSRHVSHKQRRAVRRLARTSNPARDAEVQQAWVLRQVDDLTPEQQEGGRWLLARLQPASLLELEEELQHGVERLVDKLRPSLARLSAAGESIAYVAACVAQAQVLNDEVIAALAAIGGADDVCGAHKARILIKRLRYLLAPLRNDGPACELGVAVLRQLQDLLGELHDRHVLATYLRDSAAKAAADHTRTTFAAAPRNAGAWRAPQLPGLVALAARNHAAIVSLHAQLRTDYLGKLEESVRLPLERAMVELRGVN